MKMLFALIAFATLSVSVYAEEPIATLTCPEQAIVFKITRSADSDINATATQAIIGQSIIGQSINFNSPSTVPTVELFENYIIVKFDGKEDTKYNYASGKSLVFENTAIKAGTNDELGKFNATMNTEATLDGTCAISGAIRSNVKFSENVSASTEKAGSVTFSIEYEIENCVGLATVPKTSN